jgi:porin
MRYGVSAAGGVVSLADPTATGPLNRHGNGGVYAVADQMVWRAGERSLNLFARSGVAPADRNTLSYYVDGGAGFKGLLPGRANDVLTFGVAYEKISSALTGLDQDTLFFGGPPYPTRNYEVVFELNYALQLAPWWTLQPDLQYIVHPGGNVPDPADPTNATVVKNAFIAGIRSTIKF